MISVPKKMRALQKDRRGYPIPYIVLRDTDGKPHFSINDTLRQRKALLERRCPICGTRLDRVIWFLGGPLSAFHPHGSYMDSAMHYECMRYAVQSCPYLAAPNYLGRIDAKTVDPGKLPHATVFMDTTMIPERPSLFVAVASSGQNIRFEWPLAYVTPVRPYLEVEYWRLGKQLTEEEGKPLVEQALAGRTLSEARSQAPTEAPEIIW
jgi:hypothetical protein